MSAFPALALAIALTYVIGDWYEPYLPGAFSIVLDLLLCFGLFRLCNHYLKMLKE